MPTSLKDQQVLSIKNPPRTSYVLHKFFHQSYLILEFKWSLMLILDSCRFELIKIRFLSLDKEEFQLGLGVGWSYNKFLASSSSSVRVKSWFQGLLVSKFPYICLLMIDLMFYSMNMIIIDITCLLDVMGMKGKWCYVLTFYDETC